MRVVVLLAVLVFGLAARAAAPTCTPVTRYCSTRFDAVLELQTCDDGTTRDVEVDFTRSRLVLHETGSDVTLPFQAVVTGVTTEATYAISDTARFRTPRDLLLGTLDTGLGVLPFIAARNFVTTVEALDGKSFDILGRAVSPQGAATSAAYAAKVEGGTLTACKASPPAPVDGCPADASRRYPLSVNADGTFSGSDPAHADAISFRVARSDDALVFLSADSSASGRRFEAGVEANASVEPTSYMGGDSLGRWGRLDLTVTTFTTTWSTDGGMSQHEVMAFVAGSPAGLYTVNDRQLLAQNGPVGLSAGVPGSSRDGLMQVWAAMP